MTRITRTTTCGVRTRASTTTAGSSKRTAPTAITAGSTGTISALIGTGGTAITSAADTRQPGRTSALSERCDRVLFAVEPNLRVDAHSRPQEVFFVLSRLEANAHGQTLHNLDVVARGILGGGQTETGDTGARQ